MHYINPIEILDLSNVAEISSEIIKKAKRRLFADIDLSDDQIFDYHGAKYTKSDCETAIDGLTEEFKEYYVYLLSNQKLNNFLASGSAEVFAGFQKHTLFDSPQFIHFISPFFSLRCNDLMLIALKSNDAELIENIIATCYLIEQVDFNIAFASTSSHIQNKISEINKIKEDIENEIGYFTEENVEELIDLVSQNFPIKALNSLPQYFQSQILMIAQSINYLAIAIWHAFNTTQVPNDLIEYLLNLNIGGLDRPTFENNFKIISKKHNERIEQAKNAPLLKKWTTVLLNVRDVIKKVENKTTSSSEAYQHIKDLFDLSELNSLPSFADEIRTQIGYSIRSLSISIWNIQSDIKIAQGTINLALQINLDNDAKERFKQDQTDLSEIENKYRGVLVCHFCDKNTPDESSKITKMIYKETSRSASRVQFSYVDIFIPRCKSCQTIHSKGRERYRMFLIHGIVAGAIIGAMIDEHFIIGGFIGCAIGSIAGTLMERSLFRKESIKEVSDSTLKQHPILSQRMKEDWAFDQPRA
jgi:hypothetical protein